MSDREIQELLSRYRQGNCTPDETLKIHLWYESLNQGAAFSLDEAEKNFLERRLFENINDEISQPYLRIPIEVPVVPQIWKSQFFRLGVAASVVLLLGLLFLFKKGQEIHLKSENLQRYSQQGHLKTFHNISSSTKKLKLEDNSVVSLAPGSRISYPDKFPADKREVQLEGDAFFEVSKNPSKPFFVYSGKLVAKVLGTSFRIKSNPDQHAMEVEVVTGKVSVFENHFHEMAAAGKKFKSGQGVVLTPNQRVSYFEESGHLLTSIVDQPIVIPVHKELETSLVFNNESFLDIISTLQTEYGIEIVLANDQLENCTFTGDVSDMPLYDKLDLICKANSACYEIKGTRILISGAGCD